MLSRRLSPAELAAVRNPDPASTLHRLTDGRYAIPRHVGHTSRLIRDRLLAGNARLILTWPPRHGKSMLVSTATPVWALEIMPRWHVGLAAYGQEFANEWGRKVRNLIESNPEKLRTRIRGDSSAAHRWDTVAGGRMFTVGIGGSMTGRGVDVMFVDDPHKDRAEAESEAHRKRVWEWWRSTASTRLEPGASVVVIMQRWREDDLVGRLLAEQEETGETWELVNFPAIAEEDDALGRAPGEALWPDRWPVEALEKKRRTLGAYNWASQYQQRPAPAGGAIFQRQHFRYFTYLFGDGPAFYELPAKEGGTKRVPVDRCWHFQTIDTALEAGSQNDWTVCLTAAVTPDSDLLVLHVARQRLQVPDQLPWIYAQRARYPNLAWQGVERKASGHGLIQEARRRGKPFRVLEPGDGNKVLRSTQAAVMYENGQVYHRAGADWLDAFEAELLGFPTGTHDDQVDCISYAALEAGKAPVQVFL